MALLRNLEQSLSGLVEGTIGRVFRSEVRPTEIARQLAREMEINKRVSLSRTYAPTDYLVYLSPDDRAKYAGVEDSIAEEMGAYLLEHARRERLVLVRRPLVEFRTDPRLRLGEFGIEARTAPVSAEEAPPRADPAAPDLRPRRDAPRDPSPRRSRPAEDPVAPVAPDQAPLGSTPASGGYEPPSYVGEVDDAPYEDPYAGDPFGGDPAPAQDAWAPEPTEAAAYDDGVDAGFDPYDDEPQAAAEVDWLDPVDDWQPAAPAPEAVPEPRSPQPPRDEQPPAPPRPDAAPAAANPWIDPTLPRPSRPQFAPPVVPPRPAPPTRPVPQTTLLVDGTPHHLTGDRMVLGRSRTADIVISDPSVSRQHCELRRDDRGWYAVDLGSTNGSELDGESLAEPRRLQAGQRIKLGHAAAIIEVR